MSGSTYNNDVETRGRLPLVRRSIRVDQQATLDASESGVPVVNGDRRLVVARLINQAKRLRLCFLSESTPPTPTRQVFLSTGEGGSGKSYCFFDF